MARLLREMGVQRPAQQRKVGAQTLVVHLQRLGEPRDRLADLCLPRLTGVSAGKFGGSGARRAASAPPSDRGAGHSGVAVFPTDVAIRRFADKTDTIVHWSEFDRGGHFAALEAPDLLIGDVREFSRRFR